MKDIEKIVEKQIENYHKLHLLSIELLKAMKSSDQPIDSSDLMEKRQTAIDAIAKIDPEINSNLEKLGSDHAGIKELRRLLEEIIEVDRQSSEIVQDGKLDLSREMRKFGQMKSAAKGYLGDPISGKSKFINIKN